MGDIAGLNFWMSVKRPIMGVGVRQLKAWPGMQSMGGYEGQLGREGGLSMGVGARGPPITFPTRVSCWEG